MIRDTTLPLNRREVATGLAATVLLAMAGPALGRERPGGPVAGQVRRIDPALDALIDHDARVERIADGFNWAEGPVWVPGRSMLLFSDVPANRMYRWTAERGQGIFLDPSGLAGGPDPAVREGGSNGLVMDNDGRLIIADSGNRLLARLDLATGKRQVLADRWDGKRFNSPNDAVVARDGAIYFTDPSYGLTDGDRSPRRELAHNGVYRLGPDGTLTLIEPALSMPNGIGLSPAEDRLYVSVSDEAAPRIMAYDLDREGRASNGRIFFDARPLVHPGVLGLPDGLSVDRRGNLFASGPGGLLVIDPAGKLLGVIEVAGRPVSNCAFGGKWLYMTADDCVARVKIRTRG
jgi:gluconolactonase